jgi:hypothetical protein
MLLNLKSKLVLIRLILNYSKLHEGNFAKWQNKTRKGQHTIFEFEKKHTQSKDIHKKIDETVGIQEKLSKIDQRYQYSAQQVILNLVNVAQQLHYQNKLIKILQLAAGADSSNLESHDI